MCEIKIRKINRHYHIGNAPHILQVYEVGTQTMFALILPVVVIISLQKHFVELMVETEK